MKRLLIATTNRGKQREIRALLAPQQVAQPELVLVSPDQLGIALDVLEDGDTYAANAALKAQAFAAASGLVTLADDSGLEVDCLMGAPGVHSARYAPVSGAGDADRRKLLLSNLAQHPRPWTARFRCIVALADPAGRLYLAEGVCEGEIIPEERGRNGFGYDPIFYLPQVSATMAELEMNEKNRLSHRSKAVQAALPELVRWLLPQG